MLFLLLLFVQPNCGCLDFHSPDFVSIPGAAEAAQTTLWRRCWPSGWRMTA
jgi:hypothetical protein